MMRLFEYAPYSYDIMDIYHLCVIQNLSLGEYTDYFAEKAMTFMNDPDPFPRLYNTKVLEKSGRMKSIADPESVIRIMNCALTYDQYYVYAETDATPTATRYANQIVVLLSDDPAENPVAFTALDLSQFEPDDLVYLGLLKVLNPTETAALQHLAMERLSSSDRSNLRALNLILDVLCQNQAIPRELADAYTDYSDSLSTAGTEALHWGYRLRDLYNKSFLGHPVKNRDIRELLDYFTSTFHDSFLALEKVYHVVRL